MDSGLLGAIIKVKFKKRLNDVFQGGFMPNEHLN